MAFPQQAAVDLNTVFTAHAHNYLNSKPRDQYYRMTPTLAHLRSKKKEKAGGQYLIEPLHQGGAALGGAYNKASVLAPVGADPVTQARYQWAFYREPVVIYEQDEKIASGDAVFDLVEANVEKAKNALTEKIAQHIYTTSTDSASVSLQGLNLAVPDDLGNSSTTYGGIAGATYTFWQAASNSSAIGAFATLALPAMRTAFNAASKSKGGGSPNLIVMSQSGFEAYESLVSTHHEITTATSNKVKQMADLGFATLSFKGVPVVWDPYIDSDEMYFINDDAVQLVTMPGDDFRLTDFESTKHEGLFARVAWIIWNGQMSVRERRQLAKLRGLTY